MAPSQSGFVAPDGVPMSDAERSRLLSFMDDSQRDAEALLRLVADRLQVDHGPILDTIDAATAAAEKRTLEARRHVEEALRSKSCTTDAGDQSAPPLDASTSQEATQPDVHEASTPVHTSRVSGRSTARSSRLDEDRSSGGPPLQNRHRDSQSRDDLASQNHDTGSSDDDDDDDNDDDNGAGKKFGQRDDVDDLDEFGPSSSSESSLSPSSSSFSGDHESDQEEESGVETIAGEGTIEISARRSQPSIHSSRETTQLQGSQSPRPLLSPRPSRPSSGRHRTKGWPPELRYVPGTPRSSRLDGKSALKVYCCTWNLMGNSVSDLEPLQKLIPRDAFDVYAVGTQECERTIAKSAVITRKKGWEQTLTRYFGHGYTMLRSHTLQATHLVIFVRTEILPILSNVGSAAVATGYKDTFGNKGGVGISFTLGRTSFLFIASHFEAHQNRVQQRNEHFHRIDALLALPPGFRVKSAQQRAPPSSERKIATDARGKSAQRTSSSEDPRRNSSEGVLEASEPLAHELDDDDDDDDDDDVDFPTTAPAKLQDEDLAQSGPSGYDNVSEADSRGRASARFDRVFWMGDFNYRIDAPREKVEGLINSESRLAHGALVANDQLKKEIAAGRVFRNFEEGPLNFRPTYKFDKESDAYDTSKKQRVPAWTDRILHKSTRPDTVEILHYASEHSIRMSDHRPVAAMYAVHVDGVDDPTLVGLESHEVGKAESQVCIIS